MGLGSELRVGAVLAREVIFNSTGFILCFDGLLDFFRAPPAQLIGSSTKKNQAGNWIKSGRAGAGRPLSFWRVLRTPNASGPTTRLSD